MGNHEFCTECGANDFHNGEPCDPKRKKKYQNELNEGSRNLEKAIKRMHKVVIPLLEKNEIEYEIGNNYETTGQIIIRVGQFYDKK